MGFFIKFFIFTLHFGSASIIFGGIDATKRSKRFSNQKLFRCSKSKTPVSMARINQFEYRSTHSKNSIEVQKAGGAQKDTSDIP
jgi:hypothetical protein